VVVSFKLSKFDQFLGSPLVVEPGLVLRIDHFCELKLIQELWLLLQLRIALNFFDVLLPIVFVDERGHQIVKSCSLLLECRICPVFASNVLLIESEGVKLFFSLGVVFFCFLYDVEEGSAVFNKVVSQILDFWVER
jgi:hypothetical protein